MTVQPFSVKGAFVFHTDFGMSHGLGHQIPFKVCFIRDLFAKASLIQTTLIKNSTTTPQRVNKVKEPLRVVCASFKGPLRMLGASFKGPLRMVCASFKGPLRMVCAPFEVPLRVKWALFARVVVVVVNAFMLANLKSVICI